MGTGWSTVVPAVADDAVPAARIDLVDELVLDKNSLSRNYNYFHTVLNSMVLLCTKYYQNWSMSVEDIANQTSVIFEHD